MRTARPCMLARSVAKGCSSEAASRECSCAHLVKLQQRQQYIVQITGATGSRAQTKWSSRLETGAQVANAHLGLMCKRESFYALAAVWACCW